MYGKPQEKFYTVNPNGNKRFRTNDAMGGDGSGMNDRRGGRPGQFGGRPNGHREPFTPKELCKFFLTGSCHKGLQCTFSHNLSDFPCKYLHATGFCEKGDQSCKFSHKILKTDEEINRFIDLNEAFLADLLKNKGGTNLGEYYLKRVREKEEALARNNLQNVMLPPSLIGGVGVLGFGGNSGGLGGLGGNNSANSLSSLM